MECRRDQVTLNNKCSNKRSYEDDSNPGRSLRPFDHRGSHMSCSSLYNPYLEDIHRHLHYNEEQQWLLKKGCYPEGAEINQQSRAIVIDWLIEVAHDYSLSLDSLFLAVNYFDRLIQEVPVKKDVLQLLAITCLFIASKYEEVRPLTLDQLVFAEVYSKKNILDMERIVLKNLKFKLTVSTMRNFLSRYILSLPEPLPHSFVFHTDFLSEMILSAGSLNCAYPPSQIAAAVVTVSCITFKVKPQMPIDGYAISDLRPIIRTIYMLYGHINSIPVDKPLTAAREKYTASEYGAVSKVALPHALMEI